MTGGPGGKRGGQAKRAGGSQSEYLSDVVSEVAHGAGAVLAHGAVVAVLQFLVVGDEALGGDALLGLPRAALLHAVRDEHVRLQVGLLLAAEVALLALVQVYRLGRGTVLPQQVIAATRLGLFRLKLVGRSRNLAVSIH